jgi:hypothetical protein
MTTTSKAILLLCPALLIGPSQPASAVVVAQHTASPSVNLAGFAGPPSTYVPAQTFTTTAGGTVSSVTVSLSSNGPLPSSVLVDIRTVSGGFPTTTSLGSASIPSPALAGAAQDFVADFTGAGVTLSAFTPYALVLTLPDGGAWACGEFNGTYAGGKLVQSFDNGATFSATFYSHDMQFTVATVPEPAAALLVTCGALAFLGWRRRIR